MRASSSERPSGENRPVFNVFKARHPKVYEIEADKESIDSSKSSANEASGEDGDDEDTEDSFNSSADESEEEFKMP